MRGKRSVSDIDFQSGSSQSSDCFSADGFLFNRTTDGAAQSLREAAPPPLAPPGRGYRSRDEPTSVKLHEEDGETGRRNDVATGM
ncbi:hypothetical protein EYF80_059445 [Liparis tanakae]|uniref:Uncharacterized protein n=1 Tax=Liparis tanakae TaxID=230148 RepID=A0A4Z2ENN5_9TELE|nr:hypothetical protein EYF80_059445 [Liparis tanakae]